MSLKAFHIVFVIVTTLTALFCGAWLCYEYSSSKDLSQLLGGLLSFVAAAGLVWYGKVVLRKLKHISYL